MVNDLGGLPPSHQDLSLVEFQTLLDSMSSLRMMTISPHLDATNNYLRIQALVNRSSTGGLYTKNACLIQGDHSLYQSKEGIHRFVFNDEHLHFVTDYGHQCFSDIL